MHTDYVKLWATPCGIGAAALTLVLAGGSALAQSGAASKSLCMVTGAAAVEPVGDRDGHTIQNSVGNCRLEGGALDGAVSTLNSTWEQDKLNGMLLSGDGVLRKPGAVATYRQISGQRSLLVQDGKVVGWTASGKGVFTLAAGGFASYSGKTFSWSGRSTAPNQFVIDSTVD